MWHPERKRGSSVVRQMPLVLEVSGSIPAHSEKNFSVRTRFLVSFAGMTLDKCIVLRIGTLTGCIRIPYQALWHNLLECIFSHM